MGLVAQTKYKPHKLSDILLVSICRRSHRASCRCIFCFQINAWWHALTSREWLKQFLAFNFILGAEKKSPFMWRLRMWGSLPPFLSADENFGVDLLPLVANNTKQNETKKNKTLEEQFCWIAKFFLFSPFSVYFNIFFVCTLKTHSANRKNRTCTEQFLIWEKWKHTEIGHWTHWQWYLKQIRLIYQLSFDAISLILN